MILVYIFYIYIISLHMKQSRLCKRRQCFMQTLNHNIRSQVQRWCWKLFSKWKMCSMSFYGVRRKNSNEAIWESTGNSSSIFRKYEKIKTARQISGCWKLFSKWKMCSMSFIYNQRNFGEDYHLEMEMCSIDYITAITSVMDTEEGLKRLSSPGTKSGIPGGYI